MTVVICKNGDRYGCKLGPEETLELTKKGRVRFARDGAVSTIKLPSPAVKIEDSDA